MMNLKKIALAVAMASAMAAGAANAATSQGQGKITFEGTIIEAACSIDAKSIYQTIQMGAIAKHQLEAGGKSTPVDFSIQLHDCDPSNLNNGAATVSFNGIAGSATDGLDKAMAITGVGSGAAIGIMDIGGNAVLPNTPSKEMKLAVGDNLLEFKAFVQGSTNSNIVVGAFQSVANFVMDYK